MSDFGCLEGELCGRDGCEGVIEEREADGCCSCHINPPCGHCMTPREFCPECEWDALEEMEAEELRNRPTPEQIKNEQRRWELERIRCMARRFDPKNINYKIRSHTHFSQICEGWFPAGWSRDQVRERVDGTFGGRFERFDTESQTFRFVAYTD